MKLKWFITENFGELYVKGERYLCFLGDGKIEIDVAKFQKHKALLDIVKGYAVKVMDTTDLVINSEGLRVRL